MRIIRLAAAVIPLLAASACVPLPSLNPLWDEGHAVCEPGLAGTWISDDNDEIITIAETGRKEYRMVYVSGEDASQYEVHAVRLEGRLFLDLFPDKEIVEERLHGEVYLPLIPTHFFLRADLGPDRLELAAIDDEAIGRKRERGETEIPLVKWDDGLLLTAETGLIQELVIRFADDPDVWERPDVYHRYHETVFEH
jgi:hypothetical protein